MNAVEWLVRSDMCKIEMLLVCYTQKTDVVQFSWTVLHIWTPIRYLCVVVFCSYLILCFKNLSVLINTLRLKGWYNKLSYCLLLPVYMLYVFILQCSLCFKCCLFEVWSGWHLDTWWSCVLLICVQMLGSAVDRPGCTHQSVFSVIFFFSSSSSPSKCFK
jgi:hypothetical protein